MLGLRALPRRRSLLTPELAVYEQVRSGQGKPSSPPDSVLTQEAGPDEGQERHGREHRPHAVPEVPRTLVAVLAPASSSDDALAATRASSSFKGTFTKAVSKQPPM